jgi:hypothetical protein
MTAKRKAHFGLALVALLSGILGVFHGDDLFLRAESPAPVVVELYTSQGCSSCPPADKFLRKLAGRDDGIARGRHVDYWDYLGWRDKFASPAYSARQKAYAKHAGRRSVYTPQMIIQGAQDVVGNHPMDVTDLIEKHRARPRQVAIDVSWGSDNGSEDYAGGDQVVIRARALAQVQGHYLVQLVRYEREVPVDILRGENAGRRVAYANIVTDWQVIGKWDGRAPLNAQVLVTGQAPAVILIQRAGPGMIEAAAHVPARP